MDDARVGALFVRCSAAGFGTLGVLGVVAGDAGLSMPTGLFLRFALATVLVWTALGLRGELEPLAGRDLLAGLGLGAFGYAAMSGLYFLGLEFMTAGMVGITLYTCPTFVLVLAAAFLGEPVSAVVLAGGSLVLVGVMLVPRR